MSTDLASDYICINKKNIFLYYPYFANTFLLNYSIKYEGLLGIKADSNIIKWNRESLIDTLSKEKQSNNDIIIFFATKRMLDDAFFPSGKIEFDFSLYLPRFIFIPFSIEAYRSCYSAKKFEDNYSLLIEGFREDLKEIPSIDEEKIKDYLKQFKISETIFSDTPEEAKEIINKLKVLFSKDDNSQELEVLYYGAPNSIYLLNKYPEFLPIRIDSLDFVNEKELNNYFDTKIIIYCKYHNECNSKEHCHIKSKIEKFYNDTFDKARENPKTLADVYSKFVQENKEQIPYQIFQNVECFSKAITFHHKYKTETVDSEIKVFTSDLKNLYSFDFKEDFNTYRQSRKLFKNLALAYYILLVFHYIINNERSLQKLSFREIALSLRDKTFLEGKYSLLYQNIIKTLYTKFLFEIKGSKNPINVFCTKHKLNFESKIIYYQFKDDIIEEVTNKTKEISISDAFANLLFALNDILDKDDISIIPKIIEREIKYTNIEVLDIKNNILEKSKVSSLFNPQEKREIKAIKKNLDSKSKQTQVSIKRPDIKKI